MNLNLSILEKTPELTKGVILEIEPLAPLSMVSELPGSYYKTLKSPSKKMICGLFENILGWHIDLADRNVIMKELKKIRKKQKLDFLETEGSSYTPFLMEYFDIQLSILPELVHFDDYWGRAYRRSDAVVHPNGTFNIDFELISQKRELPRDDKKPMQPSSKAIEELFKNNLSKFPLYYSTPTTREYVVVNGKYKLKLAMDESLLKTLLDCFQVNNMAYLGNSEGWVDLKLHEL